MVFHLSPQEPGPNYKSEAPTKDKKTYPSEDVMGDQGTLATHRKGRGVFHNPAQGAPSSLAKPRAFWLPLSLRKAFLN